jgi:site-specific recombinase XerD
MAILRARLTLSWQSIVVPRRAVRSAKFEGISWHTLRHSFASRLAIMGSPSSVSS